MENVKIVIVGNGSVGKTCLIHTFQNNAFPSEYIPNVYNNWSPTIMVNKKIYQIGLWDTAGQQDYDRLRPLSYPQTDIFLVCFSIIDRNSFNCITTKWIPEISHWCPNVPFFIIRTKDDLKSVRNRYENRLLIDGYSKEYKQIPMDILNVIETYFEDQVTDKEAQQLCDKVGGYKYMTCSSLQMRGLKEIFREAALCYNEQTENAKKKSKNCVIV